MSKLAPFFVLALLLVRCSDEPKDLCSRLTDNCGGTAGTTCHQNTTQEEQSYPNCTELLQAFSDCVASLTLECDGDTEITATNKSDSGTQKSPVNGTHLGTQHIVVKDSTCTLIKNGLDACRTCPTAAGAHEIAVHGIGEHCTVDSDCAQSLTCTQNVCSRPCTDASDCYARALNCSIDATVDNVCDHSGQKPVCAQVPDNPAALSY
jgi:hypothetical protein